MTAGFAGVQSGIGIIFQRDYDDTGPLIVRAFVPQGAGEACGQVPPCLQSSGGVFSCGECALESFKSPRPGAKDTNNKQHDHWVQVRSASGTF